MVHAILNRNKPHMPWNMVYEIKKSIVRRTNSRSLSKNIPNGVSACGRKPLVLGAGKFPAHYLSILVLLPTCSVRGTNLVSSLQHHGPRFLSFDPRFPSLRGAQPPPRNSAHDATLPSVIYGEKMLSDTTLCNLGAKKKKKQHNRHTTTQGRTTQHKTMQHNARERNCTTQDNTAQHSTTTQPIMVQQCNNAKNNRQGTNAI